MTCKDCKHWRLVHKKEGFAGCYLWNNYKHRRQHPTKGNSYDFEIDFGVQGPAEPYEGWVKCGIVLINDSIVTEGQDSCNFFEEL